MKIILFILFLLCTSFYEEKGIQVNVFNKENNSKILIYKVFYKMHNDQKFQRLSLKKGFLFPSEDVIDILIITRNSRVLFEEIDSKLLNEGIILNFYISKFKFTKVSCVYYCNLSVRIIGKNRVNEDACNDILRISGPLDDKF